MGDNTSTVWNSIYNHMTEEEKLKKYGSDVELNKWGIPKTMYPDNETPPNESWGKTIWNWMIPGEQLDFQNTYTQPFFDFDEGYFWHGRSSDYPAHRTFDQEHYFKYGY